MLHCDFILISIPLMANYVEYLFLCLLASARPLTLQRTPAGTAGWLYLACCGQHPGCWSSWLPSGVGVGAAVLLSCLAGAEWFIGCRTAIDFCLASLLLSWSCG